MGGLIERKPKSFYIALVFIFLLLGSNIAIQKWEWTGRVDPLLVWGTVLDVMVVLPVVVFTFLLRRKPTLSVFAPMILLGLLFIHWIVPDYAKEELFLLNVSVLILEAAVVLFEIGMIVLFVKKYPEWKRHFQGASQEYPHLLPRIFAANKRTFDLEGRGRTFSRLSGFLATDVSAVRYALFPRFDRVPPAPNSFSYHQRSEYFGVFLMLVHAMLIEIIAVHVMLMQYSHTAAWIATVLDMYALLFLIGDYQAIRKSPVILEDDRLHIQKGLRFHTVIDTVDIKELAVYEAGDEHWRKDKRAVHLGLAGFEPVPPQLVLELADAVDVHLFFGLKKRVDRIYLTLDEPERFWEAIKREGVVSKDGK